MVLNVESIIPFPKLLYQIILSFSVGLCILLGKISIFPFPFTSPVETPQAL